jgi:hypothetical protein
MKRYRVNVLSVINSTSNITEQDINGKPHIVVRGVTPVVDDIVMNKKLYPTAEIEKGYKTLERTPMPLGHPKVNGKHVSARDVQAVNDYHVGAWFQDVVHTNGKVSGDMYVDRRYAESSEHGKTLVNRLDDMAAGKNVEPIHISTGLFYSGIAANGESKGKRYSEIATNQMYDHVAILLNESGAGTPSEGVGIFVNADGTEQEIETVNLSEAADCTKEGLWNKTKFFFTNASGYSFDDIQRAITRMLRAAYPTEEYLWPDTIWPDKFIYSIREKILQQKYLIDDDGEAEFVGEPVEVVRKPTEYEIKTNGEDPMKNIIINALKEAGKPTEGKTDAELLDAYNQLNAPVSPAINTDALTAAINAAVLPLKEEIVGLKSQMNASAESEIKIKREAVKLAMNMSDEEVADLAGKALDKLYANCQSSQGLNTSFQPNAEGDQWKDYNINAGFEETK